MIILNSVEASVDLMDKRGANYSGRPYFAELEAWRSLSHSRPAFLSFTV